MFEKVLENGFFFESKARVVSRVTGSFYRESSGEAICDKMDTMASHLVKKLQ